MSKNPPTRFVLLTTIAAAAAVAAPTDPGSERLAGGTTHPPASIADPQPAGGADLREMIELYNVNRTALLAFHNLPWSEKRIERLERFDRQSQTELESVDLATLSQAGRVDYILLRNRIAANRAALARERAQLAELGDLLPFRQTVLDLEDARRNMQPVDPVSAAAQLAEFPARIRTVRERLERARQTPPPETPGSQPTPADPASPLRVPPLVARRAAGAVEALHGSLGEWFSFYDGYRPDFSWWVRKPREEVDGALTEYAKYLRESVGAIPGGDEDGLVGEPIGRPALLEDLKHEVLAYTPEELIAIAEREIAWCEGALRDEAAKLGLGDDWRAALARVKQDHVPPGQQDELVAAQAREVIQFLKDRDLVTIPALCEETWRLTMISPDTQRVLPFAAYGGQNIMIAYASEAMKHDEKIMSMRGNNRHFTRVFALHELIPGHHLQAFQTQRHRRYRDIFATPFFVEGWALYWEMTLWDMGLAQSPEDRIGMLFWRMHRAARVVVSLKFHLGQMTPADMVDFLVNRIGHEKLGAVGEVRRFIGDGYSPLYQCGYIIGGLQLRALRREVMDARMMPERDFNDAVVTRGPIPIELIRSELLNRPVQRDATANWRFAGEVQP